MPMRRLETWASRPRSLSLRLAISAGIIALATGVQWLLRAYLQGAAFLVYYPSLFLIALLGGPGITIGAALVEGLLASLLFIPQGQPVASQWVRVGLFLFFSALIAQLTRLITASRGEVRLWQRRFQHLIDVNIIGVVTWTLDGRVTGANEVFLKMVGYTREELEAGKIDWKRMTPAEWGQADERAVQQLRETGVSEPFMKEYVRRDGQRVPVMLGSALFVGSRDSGLSFILDISEQKRVSDELRRRVTELDRSNAELAQFAYIASHDLKEPLRGVRTQLQLLERRLGGITDPHALESMRFAMNEAGRMYHLVEDVLEYARVSNPQAKQVPLQPEDELRQVTKSLDRAIRESGARIHVGPLPPVTATPSQFRQLFENLIENSLKFRGAEPPEVTIAGERRGDLVEFTIRDNGIGIDPEYGQRIFQIFQRLHSRSAYPGTGIGLAICKKIVEQHGGNIWLQPTTGPGSEFRCTLPAA